ncbi:uncharacterized protein LOC120328519 [Styela clava]
MFALILTILSVSFAVGQSHASDAGASLGVLLERINKLEELLNDIPIANLQDKGLCHVSYQFKCFTILTFDSQITRAEGEKACWELGARLGNVYSKEHKKMIEDHVIALEVDANLWLGMSEVPATQEVFMSFGSKVPYNIDWHPGWPALQSDRTLMALAIRPSPVSTNKGFFNAHDRDTTNGVLCEV